MYIELVFQLNKKNRIISGSIYMNSNSFVAIMAAAGFCVVTVSGCGTTSTSKGASEESA